RIGEEFFSSRVASAWTMCRNNPEFKSVSGASFAQIIVSQRVGDLRQRLDPHRAAIKLAKTRDMIMSNRRFVGRIDSQNHALRVRRPRELKRMPDERKSPAAAPNLRSQGHIHNLDVLNDRMQIDEQ